VTAGNAAHSPRAKLIAEARRRAAERWGVAESDVHLRAWRSGSRGRRVTLADLAEANALAAGASFEVPKVTYAGCAAAVVADVDPEPARSPLQRVVVGADVGRAVNPALVDGQLVGGVAFGIGNTLHESLAYDAGGQLLLGTLMDYALPFATDVPRSTASTRKFGRRPTRSGCAVSASAATRPGRRHRQRRVRCARARRPPAHRAAVDAGPDLRRFTRDSAAPRRVDR
jgi:CO/xanthine dehydrogenase Mo-binding subunit